MNKNLLSMGSKKILRWIFYLLIFLIPANLGKHFPQNWSYVNGILVDYLIPTLYLTDILIITLLACWILQSLRNNFQFLILNLKSIFKNLNIKNSIKIKNFKLKILVLIIVLILVIYNLFFIKNLFAAGYKIIKIVEFGLLIIYIKHNININKDIKNIVKVLSLSVLWQSSLAILQWFKQGSIFGYWFFGEQPFNTASHGIKLVSWFGEMKVVPMGTFPHPNVLAGFLVISLMLLIFNFKFKIFNHMQLNLQCKQFLIFNALILGIISLFLTFSFTAWIVFLGYLGCLSYLLIKKTRKNSFKILLFTFYFLLFAFCFKSIDPASLSRRFQLSEIALKMWLSAPLFGVGLNNFIPRMEQFGQVTANIRFLQPVHNIYLLALAETGIVGFIGLIWLIWWVGKNLWNNRKKNMTVILLYCYIVILFLGFFDHYLLTIQQGMLLFSLIIGLSLNGQRDGNL